MALSITYLGHDIIEYIQNADIRHTGIRVSTIESVRFAS
jgi:hypothetical protein